LQYLLLLKTEITIKVAASFQRDKNALLRSKLTSNDGLAPKA